MMNNITHIGIDMTKNRFSVCAVNSDEKTVLLKRTGRAPGSDGFVEKMEYFLDRGLNKEKDRSKAIEM